MNNNILYILGVKVVKSIFDEHTKIINFKYLFYDDLNTFLKSKNKSNKNEIIIIDETSLEKINNVEVKSENPIILLTSSKNVKLSEKKYKNFEIYKCPINLLNLISKINILFSSKLFKENSNINFYGYTLNLNSKLISKNTKKLKLTERECNFLIYLKNNNSPQRVSAILQKLWKYSKGVETHTVETHVHRLRKKIFNIFKEKNLIKNNKKGYYI